MKLIKLTQGYLFIETDKVKIDKFDPIEEKVN